MIQELDIKDLVDTAALRNVLLHLKKGRVRYVLKENDEPLAMLLSLDKSSSEKKTKPGEICSR